MQTTSTITKGLIIALIMIAASLAVYFSGVEMNGPVKWLNYCILIGGVIISIIQYGKQIDHNATFGNYFAHGFKVTATVTVIMIVYIIIFLLLFPDFKEKALSEAAKNMNQQNISEDQKATALEITRKMFTVAVVGGTLLINMVIGVIAALIGAAVTNKNPRPLQD